MSFLTFNAKPENELIDLLKPSDGNFEVLEATEKYSKSNGNPMIELKLKAWDEEGREGNIFDYLMLNNTNFALRRIRHFCYSCGLGEHYEKGTLSGLDCVGKQGKIKIDIKKAENGYPDKNIVKDYITETNGEVKKSDASFTSAQDEKFDDDIPF
jgi:hypothetical protein